MLPLRAGIIGLFLAAPLGCSGGAVPNYTPPTHDPAADTQAAINQLDKNKNGQLDGGELNSCPALKLALPAIDKNGDKSISADELKQRVELYNRHGVVSLTCTVTFDGAPMAGAIVTFEPEPFMGSGLKSATTTCDKNGVSGEFQIDGKPWTAIPAGLYRIKVTKDGANLHPRYNTETILGREIVNDPRVGGAAIDIALTFGK